MAKKKSKKSQKSKSGLDNAYVIPQQMAVAIIVVGFLAWVYALNYMNSIGSNLLALL